MNIILRIINLLMNIMEYMLLVLQNKMLPFLELYLLANRAQLRTLNQTERNLELSTKHRKVKRNFGIRDLNLLQINKQNLQEQKMFQHSKAHIWCHKFFYSLCKDGRQKTKKLCRVQSTDSVQRFELGLELWVAYSNCEWEQALRTSMDRHKRKGRPTIPPKW